MHIENLHRYHIENRVNHRLIGADGNIRNNDVTLDTLPIRMSTL